VLQTIKSFNVKVGVSLNPATPLDMLDEILPEIDLVLVMTVNPGFGGQSFISGMLNKISRLRATLDKRCLPAELEVDGGINEKTAYEAVKSGATVLVAGAAVFNEQCSIKDSLNAILTSINQM
jgi:ribulose-phosphate 3-epimerase